MKKWQIIVLSVIAAAAVLAATGTVFYKYYLVPKYMRPIAEKVTEYLDDDDVLDEVYSDVVRLHDEGKLDDDKYSEFIRKYKAYERETAQSEADAREIIEEKEQENKQNGTDTQSLTAKYASNRVGVQIIQTNDGSDSVGKSSVRYSSERTSDRLKAEDVVEAEKIISETDEEDSPDTDSEDEELKTGDERADRILEKMTKEDRSLAMSLLGKVDRNYAESLLGDWESLKEYLHSELTDEEYDQLRVLRAKYATELLE